jgi:hypothetical protein
MKKLVFGLVLAIFIIFSTTPAFAEGKNQLIIINKSTNQLAFFENGKIVQTFKVATGKKASYTPEGTFQLVNKIKNRPYYKDGIPGGDPRNPLGDRWLGLNARGTYGTTYAIHGNSNPNSIGKYVSSGCVRMYDDEVRWLFDQVELHTKVVIGQFKAQTFEAIASQSGYTVKAAPPVCKGICYGGKELSKGQIGFVTIQKPMTLLKKSESGKYEATSTTLPPGAVYKVYNVDTQIGAVNIGGGVIDHNLTRIAVDYLPKEVLQKAAEYFTPEEPPAPPACKGICYEGKELSKGQIGFVTIQKPMTLLTKKENGKYEATKTILQPEAVYKVYHVDHVIGAVNIGGGVIDFNPERIHVTYLPAAVMEEANQYFQIH